MASLDLLLEAEKRGILPPNKEELLSEARRRGLVAATVAPPASPTPQQADPAKADPLTWGGAATQAVGNIPSSAMNLAKNIVTPILHPIDTATALKDIGSGLVSKAQGAVGIKQDPAEKAEREAKADAVGKFFADRYGGVENFKKTLADDPVGLIADLSVVLSGGSLAGARAGGVVGKVAKTAKKVGEVIDPVRAMAKVVGSGAKHAAHLATGLGDEVLGTAVKAGMSNSRAFVDNMRGHAPATDVIDMAKSALDAMRKERGAAYAAGMTGVKANQTPLSYGAIQKALADAQGKAMHKGVAVKSEEAVATFQKIQNKVAEWQKNGLATADDFDALKQAIGDIRQEAKPGTLSRNIADSVYNATKATIVKQAPDYAKTMLGYSEASEKLNELSKTFSLGEKAMPDTALRKLQSVTRNNVNTNYGRRTTLMSDLAKYEPDLMPAIAGQATSSFLPRGLARLGAQGAAGAGMAMMNPYTVPLLLASSPRLAGEAAFATGRAFSGLKSVANPVGITTSTAPGIAQAAFQAGRLEEQQPLSGGIGPNYDEYGNPIRRRVGAFE